MTEPRIIEVLRAEQARMGGDEFAALNQNAPPLIKATALADFLLQLEILLVTVNPRAAQDIRTSLQFVFDVLNARPILQSPEFKQASDLLKRDYLDAIHRLRND